VSRPVGRDDAFGADRRDLVQRKLKQHYRNTPYVAAWLLGRDKSKRRDDRYLFSALTNPKIPVSFTESPRILSYKICAINYLLLYKAS